MRNTAISMTEAENLRIKRTFSTLIKKITQNKKNYNRELKRSCLLY